MVAFVQDKSGCFSNEKQAVITFTLSFTFSLFPLEVIFSIYIYIYIYIYLYIYVVEYSFKSLNTRKHLFQIQQTSRFVLKNSCKKLFYDVKCNCFALTYMVRIIEKYLYRNSVQLELQAILDFFTDVFWGFEWQLGDNFLEEKVLVLGNNFVKGTHRENAPTTQGFTKTMTWTKWRFAYLVTTPLVVIGPFWTSHSICYNIGFWPSSFI